VTTQPSLTDPPVPEVEVDPVHDWRSPEYQAELARQARDGHLAEARDALETAQARARARRAHG
jgi:hypothetical protein